MKRMLSFAVLVAAVAGLALVQAGERGQGRGGNRNPEARRAMLERLKENAPDDIKALIDKSLQDGAQLTDDENQKLRTYMREQFQQRARAAATPEVRALMDKRDRGEALTAEEQQQLNSAMRGNFGRGAAGANAAAPGATAAPGAAAPGAAAGPGAPGFNRMAMQRFQPPTFASVEANPRDAARLRAADVLFRQGKHQEAVDALASIIKESPQPEVVAAAHLNMARIYRRNLLLPDKAAEEFLVVRGNLAETAVRELSEMYEETGEPEKAIELLKGELEKAKTPAEKLVFLTALGDVYDRQGQLDNALATFNEIANTLKYEDAMKMPAKSVFAQNFFGMPQFPMMRRQN